MCGITPRCPLWVDTVEKGILRGPLSNIDSRRASNEQDRFKKSFARIRLLQILIPQLHFGYLFNTIDHTRSFGHVGSMSGLLESGHGGPRPLASCDCRRATTSQCPSRRCVVRTRRTPRMPPARQPSPTGATGVKVIGRVAEAA